MAIRQKLVVLSALVLLLGAGGASCRPTPKPTPSVRADGCPNVGAAVEHGDGTLRVLAGSELRDLAEVKDADGATIVDHIRTDTGIRVEFSYVGTLDAVQQIATGTANDTYDAAWFASNHYLELYLKDHPGAGSTIGTSTDIMRSPVVLGVRQPVVTRLGWQTAPAWVDIARAAARHEFGFAMTNPAASNSGFTALASMATALAGTEGPISLKQLEAVSPQLTALFTAQQLTAGSSGWLKDAYLKRVGDGSPIDAMVNYESVLLSVNAGASNSDRLTLIYPTDGVITADYPFTPLHGSDNSRRNSQIVVNYLCQASVQAKLMTTTHRRPSRVDVTLAAEFGQRNLRELRPPDQLVVADTLIRSFGNIIRRPSRTIYVLDLSGSMNTVDAPDPAQLDQPNPPKISRVVALQRALLGLTGADTSLAAQFAVFHEREQIILITFSDAPNRPVRFQVPTDRPTPVLNQIATAVRGMRAQGNTAIYEALVAAYGVAGEVTDEDRYTTIVLLSDGKRTTGRDLTAFRQFYESLPLAQRQVPVFSVLIGEGNTPELTTLSTDITNGEFFDARTRLTLSQVFKDIRGYQ